MRQAPVQRGPDNQVVQIVAVNVTGSNCHSKTLSHLTKKIDFWQNITPNRFWYDLYKEWSPSDGFRPRRICSQPARILWQVELAKRNSFQCKTFFNQSKGDAGENENLHPCRHPRISSKAVCAQVDCTLQRIMSPFEFGFQAFFVTSVTRT